MPRSKRLIKITVALVALAVFGFLFVRSARDSRATPYTVERAHLGSWTLAVEPASSPGAPVLVLLPPQEFQTGLFRQVFARAMESLNAPAPAAIPLVLKGELDVAFGGRATPNTLLAVARSAGLDASAFRPRCLAYRRTSGRDGTRQLYFVLFDAPAFTRFREQIGLLPGGIAERAAYDPAALSPVLFVAATDAAFNSWLPLHATPDTDCVAPIVTG